MQVETSVAMEKIVKEMRRMYSVMSVILVEEVMLVQTVEPDVRTDG